MKINPELIVNEAHILQTIVDIAKKKGSNWILSGELYHKLAGFSPRSMAKYVAQLHDKGFVHALSSDINQPVNVQICILRNIDGTDYVKNSPQEKPTNADKDNMKTTKARKQKAERIAHIWLRASEAILKDGRSPCPLSNFDRYDAMAATGISIDPDEWDSLKALAIDHAKYVLQWIGKDTYPLTLKHFTTTPSPKKVRVIIQDDQGNNLEVSDVEVPEFLIGSSVFANLKLEGNQDENATASFNLGIL